jgi:hypothetical protein
MAGMRYLLLASAVILGACGGSVVVDTGSGGATATTSSATTTFNTSTGTGAATVTGTTTFTGTTSTEPTCGVTGSSSSGGPVDHCATALHLPLNGKVSGSTCGGTSVGESPCQEPGHPDVFVYVDAPAGTSFQVTSSPGASILAFPNCDSEQTNMCNFGGGELNPPAGTVLFGVERVDTCCGEFTVSAMQM